MIIVVDDSGDPGLNPGKGASSHFVIAAISFAEDADAERTSAQIDEFKKQLGWQKGREFKFRKANVEVREGFFKMIARAKFKVAIVILDKNNVDKKIYDKDASGLYNATILKALNSLNDVPQNAHIYIDGEGGNGYKHRVKTYFRQNLRRDAIKELTYRDSRKDNLIQLADMIAGAARYSVSRREDADVYLKILKRHIDTVEITL